MAQRRRDPRTRQGGIDEFDIRTPSATVHAGTLSGGNQQKAVVAREFSRSSRVLVLDQPTRGLDVGSIEFIHKQVIAKRDAGAAILLVSAELDEVLELSDRIGVMYRGELVALVDGPTQNAKRSACSWRRGDGIRPRWPRRASMAADLQLAQGGAESPPATTAAEPREASLAGLCALDRPGHLDRPGAARRCDPHHPVEPGRPRDSSTCCSRSTPMMPLEGATGIVPRHRWRRRHACHLAGPTAGATNTIAATAR